MASSAVVPDPSDIESASPPVVRLVVALGVRMLHLLVARIQRPI